MNWKQLDSRDAQLQEMIDERRVRHRGISAAEMLRNVWVKDRCIGDVHLVNQRPIPGCARRNVAVPIEPGIDQNACWHQCRGVNATSQTVRARFGQPVDATGDCAGVGIDE